MSIKIHISTVLKQYTNDQQVVEVDGSTVGECLKHLGEQFPDLGKRLISERGILFDYVSIYVNGESAYPEQLAKPVKDGDELHIMFLIGGG